MLSLCDKCHEFYKWYRLFLYIFFWVIKISVNEPFFSLQLDNWLEFFKPRNKEPSFSCYRRHIIFLIGLIAALIIFLKYTDPICIFNRVHLQFVHRSCHPAFRSTCRAILSRGTNSPRRDLPDETRYSQFRSTIAGIEKQRGFILLFLTGDWSPVSPQPSHALRASFSLFL